jgi:hypothetical protein
MKHKRKNKNLGFGDGLPPGNEFAMTKKGYMKKKRVSCVTA